MSRRTLHIILHWSVFFLILTMVKGGVSAPWVRWTYCALIALWVGVAVTRGRIGRAGPKLSPAVRAAYPWAHGTIYLCLGVSATLNAGELTGLVAPGPAWASLLVLLGIGAFHGLFQMWRHTALFDNALLLITLKFMHKHL